MALGQAQHTLWGNICVSSHSIDCRACRVEYDVWYAVCGVRCAPLYCPSRCQKASLAGLLGGMSLGECTQKGSRQLGIHILVVAYRNTTHYSVKAPWNL